MYACTHVCVSYVYMRTLILLPTASWQWSSTLQRLLQPTGMHVKFIIRYLRYLIGAKIQIQNMSTLFSIDMFFNKLTFQFFKIINAVFYSMQFVF